MHFHGENPEGLGVEMDSKPAGEVHAGSSPMELVLQALGGCTGMDAVFVLRKRRLEPERFEVLVEGIKREEHPRIYREINITYRAKGQDITIKELERAARLSMETYCGVSGMIKATVKVTWKCEIIE